MILGFNKRFPDKILSGEKIHTIREDKHDRWKAGNKIHFATGVRTKNYDCFHVGKCRGTQRIEIKYISTSKQPAVYIDGRLFSFGQAKDIDVLCDLAFNDGFNTIDEFFEWFSKDFTGKIIHWTDKRY